MWGGNRSWEGVLASLCLLLSEALLQVLELRRHPSAVCGHEGTGAITRDNASQVLRLFRSLGHIQNPPPVLAALPGIVLSRLK